MHVAFAQFWRSQRFATTQAARDEVVELGRETIADGFKRIDALLRGREWFVGDRFSVADTYPLVFFRWGGLIGLDMSRFEDWSHHTRRMLNRPAVQRALSTEEIEIAVAS
nr:glutathione binding-like protein [Sphingomonas sp. HDW15A]